MSFKVINKVVIVSSCFGTYGGIEAFVLAIGKFLNNKDNCSIRIIWKKVGNFTLTEQLEKQCHESGVSFNFVDARSKELWNEIREADIVHAQNSPPDVVLFSKCLKKPLVLTIHNRRMKEHRWKSLVWFLLQRLANRRWYNSEFVRRSWEGEKEVLGSRVIPTVSNLPTGVVPINQRKGFCFASRWIPNKGIEVLLEAYQRLKLNPTQWPLQMIGEGPLFFQLRKQYESTLGIYFHGFVSDEEKADLIRHSYWMVVPPNTLEDLGLTAIEARNVGVPVIATLDGGLPEAAGSEAILCNPGSVESLQKALLKASEMTDEEYQQRSQKTYESLLLYLMSMDKYPELYREIKAS